MVNKRVSFLVIALFYCQAKQLPIDIAAKYKAHQVEHDVNSSKKIKLFRDVSWRVYGTYCFKSSKYRCLPRLYEDKVTFLQEELSGDNIIFSLFKDLIPVNWNVNTGKTTVWNLDPFDSLDLGVQVANIDIVKTALEILPISRASAPNGLSTDWRKIDPATAGKIDITQKLTISMESMSSKINKYRALKGVAFAGALLSYFGLTNNVLFQGQKIFEAGFVSQDLNAAKDATQTENSKDKPEKNYFACSRIISTALAVSSGLIAQYMQNKYINKHLAVYELIINSDKVIFDRPLIKGHLQGLYTKVRRLGLHKKAGERLQTLIAKI